MATNLNTIKTGKNNSTVKKITTTSSSKTKTTSTYKNSNSSSKTETYNLSSNSGTTKKSSTTTSTQHTKKIPNTNMNSMKNLKKSSTTKKTLTNNQSSYSGTIKTNSNSKIATPRLNSYAANSNYSRQFNSIKTGRKISSNMCARNANLSTYGKTNMCARNANLSTYGTTNMCANTYMNSRTSLNPTTSTQTINNQKNTNFDVDNMSANLYRKLEPKFCDEVGNPVVVESASYKNSYAQYNEAVSAEIERFKKNPTQDMYNELSETLDKRNDDLKEIYSEITGKNVYTYDEWYNPNKDNR